MTKQYLKRLLSPDNIHIIIRSTITTRRLYKIKFCRLLQSNFLFSQKTTILLLLQILSPGKKSVFASFICMRYYSSEGLLCGKYGGYPISYLKMQTTQCQKVLMVPLNRILENTYFSLLPK